MVVKKEKDTFEILAIAVKMLQWAGTHDSSSSFDEVKLAVRQKLVESLKERDKKAKVREAGEEVRKGGRKRVTNNEVKVVDDVGDDDATEKRRSKRSRNK